MKGNNGRVGIVGGSASYVGAPFFAASASFATGADLVYVYCDQQALIPLKVLLPEAIVVDYEGGNRPNSNDLRRLDALLIGCGLGKENLPCVKKMFDTILEEPFLTIILDGDALPDPQYHYADFWARVLNRGFCDSLILTPNAVEAERVKKAIALFDQDQEVKQLKKCSYVAITKGPEDHIVQVTDGVVERRFLLDCEGTTRRCGGLGDCLAGIIAAGVATRNARYRVKRMPMVWASDFHYVARSAAIMRRACRVASVHVDHPRGLLPKNVIEHIPSIAEALLEEPSFKESVETAEKKKSSESNHPQS